MISFSWWENVCTRSSYNICTDFINVMKFKSVLKFIIKRVLLLIVLFNICHTSVNIVPSKYKIMVWDWQLKRILSY